MVIAGPGTGKTTVLTLRIANILRKTDTAPQNILALTFTEVAAYEMRKRLLEIIGSAAYRVKIFTFHGFCNDIIRRFPEEFPQIIGGANLSEADAIKILKNAIDSTELSRLKPYGDKFYYLRPILASISALKRENVGVEDFTRLLRNFEMELKHKKKTFSEGEKLAAEKEISKNKDLLKLYKIYESELSKNRLYDYDDMIIETVRALTLHKKLLLSLQEENQYILVDEHQDTNNAQNKVLELLASFHSNPNVFMVGDEKQAIFRFQGASLNNFLYFTKLYKRAKVIRLANSYRSTQTVLDAADSLLKSGLKANKKGGESINLYAFTEPEAEYFFITEDIAAKLKNGVAPSEIAVFYRDNKDAFPLARYLGKYNIPFEVESEENILEDIDISKLITIFRTIENFGEDEHLLNFLHLDFLGVKSADIYMLLKARKRSGGLLELLGNSKSAQIAKLYNQLSRWHSRSKNIGLIDLFEDVVNTSGFLDYIINTPDSISKLDKLNVLFNEVKTLVENHRDAGLKTFLDYIDLMQNHNIAIKRSFPVASVFSEKVRIMTAHRSKGREFDYVYITHAYDGHFGNRRAPVAIKLPAALGSATGTNDDERRLFYVALTRAKKSISITYSSKSTDGSHRLPSQFIEEISKHLIKAHDTRSYEEKFRKERHKIWKPVKSKKPGVKDKEYLNNLFKEYGLSVTALNNYLECPWKYFYNNLLRVPTALQKTQMYGIAVHAALKDFFEACKKGKKADKKFLLSALRKNLEHEPLNSQDFKESMQKGERALRGWHDAYKKSFPEKFLNEFKVEGVSLDGIKLTGKLDRVDVLNSKNEVAVVDYKTAQPKSRNSIEGKTRLSEGNYKRQLVFYNLLLNLYGKYKMKVGVIDFIEPDKKGRYKKEKFEIGDDEIWDLQKLIKRVADEIFGLKFWNKNCGDKKCEFCRLRGMNKKSA